MVRAPLESETENAAPPFPQYFLLLLFLNNFWPPTGFYRLFHFVLFIVFDKFAFNFGRSAVAVQNPLSLLLKSVCFMLPFLTLGPASQPVNQPAVRSASDFYTGKILFLYSLYQKEVDF